MDGPGHPSRTGLIARGGAHRLSVHMRDSMQPGRRTLHKEMDCGAGVKTLFYLEKVIGFLFQMSVFRKLLPDKVEERLRAKCFLSMRYMPKTL